MEIKKLLITGDAIFINRYQNLFKSMSPYLEQVDYLPLGSLEQNRQKQKIKQLLPKFLLKPAEKLFRKNQQTFIKKSLETEENIRKLAYSPDLVFHIFALYCPFWEKFDIPYVMFLDYNMALAAKNWSDWSPFNNQKELDFWLDCERQAYGKAHHLFPKSNIVKKSLIEDYGIPSEKITVVGASGNFPEPYQGEKSFGSKQILFNGSDFERKGGNLLLAAFKQVKQVIPDARLAIIGKNLSIKQDGVETPGIIRSTAQMQELFLKSDLVVAPAYCDPFPVFLMEAMNYGVPCIVSDKDGMPEIVDNDVNGVVIHDPTPQILADRIITLLTNPALLNQMSGQAREKMKNQLNWDKIAANIIQVLSDN